MEVRVHELDQHLLNKDSFLRSTPTLLPAYGHISSGYGPRMSPYAQRIKMHEGIDIGAPVGTTIVAPADGVVTFSGPKQGFGNFVQIDHGYGVETIFGHASTLKVKKGQKIIRGDRIATVGNTGYSTGPHVHYEVRVNGTPVDPLYYMLN
jgi:murein DD-endopeptidase MepM/ murein hydrolase activator NlpD